MLGNCDMKFIEFPMSEFIKMYPRYGAFLRSLGVDTSDAQYIVRMSDTGIELGYPSDKWTIS